MCHSYQKTCTPRQWHLKYFPYFPQNPLSESHIPPLSANPTLNVFIKLIAVDLLFKWSSSRLCRFGVQRPLLRRLRHLRLRQLRPGRLLRPPRPPLLTTPAEKTLFLYSHCITETNNNKKTRPVRAHFRPRHALSPINIYAPRRLATVAQASYLRKRKMKSGRRQVERGSPGLELETL